MPGSGERRTARRQALRIGRKSCLHAMDRVPEEVKRDLATFLRRRDGQRIKRTDIDEFYKAYHQHK